MTADMEPEVPSIDDQTVSESMRAHITATLRQVCAAHDVRLLYAAESGSRAWGFGSPDSDYDVRFIYAHAPAWYLGLTERRDVIERDLDAHLVDLAGWDVRKALRLLLKSNPALYEWLVSPIVYVDDGTFRSAAQAMFEQHASPRALAAHYWSIARGQWRHEIEGRNDVRLKKYFYVVRPLLSLMFVAGRGVAPPMDIDQLMAKVSLPAGVAGAVDALLKTKRLTPELGRGGHVAAIDDWATDALMRFEPSTLTLPNERDVDQTDAADRLFRETIGLGNV